MLLLDVEANDDDVVVGDDLLDQFKLLCESERAKKQYY